MVEALHRTGEPSWIQASLRKISHEHLADLWQRRHGPRHGWADEDRQLLAAMEEHREFHPLWNRLSHHAGKDIRVGDVNPLMHVVVHAILATQLERSNPPEVAQALQALMRRGFTRHRALHVMGYALTDEIEHMMEKGEPFNEKRYRSRLRFIQIGCEDPTTLDRLVRRTGRNDPCPCGSGVKFKKCCQEFLPLSLDPEDWAFLLAGGTLYCTYGYAAKAPDDDPSVLLQNISAVALVLDERLADSEGALLCFREMLQIAERAGKMVENVLDDITIFCLNHTEFAREGLAAAERLLREFPSDDPLIRVPTELDRADFLTHLGRVEEARAIYERALAMAGREDADPELREIVHNRWEDWLKHRVNTTSEGGPKWPIRSGP